MDSFWEIGVDFDSFNYCKMFPIDESHFGKIIGCHFTTVEKTNNKTRALNFFSLHSIIFRQFQTISQSCLHLKKISYN